MPDTNARYHSSSYVPIDRSGIKRPAPSVPIQPEPVAPAAFESAVQTASHRIVQRQPIEPVFSLFSVDGITPQARRPSVFEQVLERPPQPPPIPSEPQLHEQPVPPESKALITAEAGSVASALLFLSENPLARFKSLKSVTAATAAVVVFTVGMAIFVSTLKTNKQVVAQVSKVASAQTLAATTDAPSAPGVPSEKPVTQGTLASYKVAADSPRFIRIARLGVQSRVTPVGLLGNGALDTPKNIYDTGWYKASSKPGENGAMLLVGHVHGPTAPGVFYNIKNLVAGDEIAVERGDGKTIKYKVVKKEQVPVDKVDMAASLTPVTPNKPGLNLMTCGGKYNTAKSEYEDRVIVYTEQI